jgi:hypothetical protein
MYCSFNSPKYPRKNSTPILQMKGSNLREVRQIAKVSKDGIKIKGAGLLFILQYGSCVNG